MWSTFRFLFFRRLQQAPVRALLFKHTCPSAHLHSGVLSSMTMMVVCVIGMERVLTSFILCYRCMVSICLRGEKNPSKKHFPFNIIYWCSVPNLQGYWMGWVYLHFVHKKHTVTLPWLASFWGALLHGKCSHNGPRHSRFHFLQQNDTNF